MFLEFQSFYDSLLDLNFVDKEVNAHLYFGKSLCRFSMMEHLREQNKIS
jgi:hypothetical protein